MTNATAHDIQYALDRLTRKRTVVTIHPAASTSLASAGLVSVRLSRDGETAVSDVLTTHEALTQAEARLEETISSHATR